MCTKISLISSEPLVRLKWDQKVSFWNSAEPLPALWHDSMFIFMTICSYYVNDKFIYIINIHIYDPGGITESRIVSSQCLILAFEIMCCAWRSPELTAGLSLVCQAVASALSCSQGQLQRSLWQELFGLRTFFSWCKSELSSDLAAACAAEILLTQQSVEHSSVPSFISQWYLNSFGTFWKMQKKTSFSPSAFYFVVFSSSPNAFSVSFSLFLPDFI